MEKLCIINIDTNETEREFDITGKSDRAIEKLYNGIATNLNWSKYKIQLQKDAEQ